jgi:hypothetical protein
MAVKGAMALVALMASLCLACEGSGLAPEVDEARVADAATCLTGGSAMIQRSSPDKLVKEHVHRKSPDRLVGKHMLNEAQIGNGSTNEAHVPSEEIKDDQFRVLATLSTQNMQPVGMSAELNEAGYQSVVERKSNKDMGLFVLRMLKNMNLHVADKGSTPFAFNTSSSHPFFGFVSWYSGVKQSQSFANLKEEVTSMSKNMCSWVKPKAMSALSTNEETGETARLSEEGYRAVAARSNTTEMAHFVRRVIKDMGMHVVDDGGLKGFVPYFDCTKGAKAYADLRQELAQDNAWIKKDGRIR